MPLAYRKSKFLFAFLFLISSAASAQNVTYYPFNSVLGISTNINKPVWTDLRFFTNSYFTSLTTEISPEFRVASTMRADFYAGGGVKLNTYDLFEGNNGLEGYFLNIGVKARPFDKYKKLNLTFEISPYAEREMDAGLFRTMLGIGYNFGKK